MKIAVFDAKSYDEQSFNNYQGKGHISFKYFDTKLSIDTVKLAHGFDGVCVFVNDTVDAPVIDKLSEYGIKIIALRCAGFNNVDYKYAKEKNIPVVRVPAYSPYAVAEHAMALLLTINRRIHKAYIRTRDFNFSLNELTGMDLYGKTVGIIGTGKIGQVFANICKGFGMKILAYDKFPAKNVDYEYVELDRLFNESDIISFHCPLTDETYHMVNENTIKQMKKGVTLINTSRGALIDAKALLEEIKNRHIGAACLDVYEEETEVFYEDRSGHIMQDDILARLISMPNVIVTSHQAFLTKEALSNIAETTFENIKAVMSGAECHNIVE